MLYNTEWPNVDGFGPLTGYDVDASNLRALLPEMGYDIVADRQNLSADEMYGTVRDLAVADDFAQYDALMVILLSHGSDNRVYGADGDVVLLDSLYTLVSPVVCPLLKDKPKLSTGKPKRVKSPRCLTSPLADLPPQPVTPETFQALGSYSAPVFDEDATGLPVAAVCAPE